MPGEERLVAASRDSARVTDTPGLVRVDAVDEAERRPVRQQRDERVGVVGHASRGYRRVRERYRPVASTRSSTVVSSSRSHGRCDRSSRVDVTVERADDQSHSPVLPPPGGFCVRVAIVFPGQGTQTPGMGAPWQDHPAWKIVEQAEGALGEPLRSLVLDAPAEQLARTRDAQLAVLCTSLVAWEAAAAARSTTSSRSPATRSGR